MMQQYQDAKAACPDALLLFRMGDFYELFHDDAKTAARVLGLALTSRDKGENAMPMAGFPHHQLRKLSGQAGGRGHAGGRLRSGRRPEAGQGPRPPRSDARSSRPARVTDDALLDPHASNYLAAVVLRAREVAGRRLAWVELSTGRFYAATFPPEQLRRSTRADRSGRMPGGRRVATPLRGTGDRRPVITRRPGLGVRAEHGRRVAHAALRHGGTGRLRLRRRARRAGDPRRRRDPRLPDRDAKDLARAHRPADPLSRRRDAGDRRIDPPQPGDHAHAPRRPPRGLAVGRARSHGHADGLALLADWLANPLTDLAAIDARLDAVAELVADPRLADDLQREAPRHLRPGAAAGPRDHRPGEPARSGGRRPDARGAAGDQGQARRPARASCSAELEGELDLCAEIAREARKRAWPTIARSPAATAASSATAFTPISMRCASWPAAASSGSPAIRPRRSPGPASRA